MRKPKNNTNASYAVNAPNASYTTQTAPTYSPAPPTGIPGYTFIRPLGRGSQGEIWLATRENTGEQVAVKKLNIESVKSWKAYDLFQREAHVLAELDMPGIAHFYEAIERLEDNPPCAYIVQEYIQGFSLAEMQKKGHRFTIDRIYDIILQLLDILEKLHNHVPPIIHRDIKPSNILLKPLHGDNYQVYLIDFGAVANPQVQGGGSTVAGTFGYMPPEQLTGRPVPASDVYALAAVAVHLITGKSPADMPVKDFHLIFEPDMQFMPVQVVNTIRQMLEPDIANRLCDYNELKRIFSNFQQDIYDQDSSTAIAALSDNKYNEKLREVNSYTQPGNIELWQRLPDITPREIPAPYKYLTSRTHPQEPLYFRKKSSIYQSAYQSAKEQLDKTFEMHGKNEEKGPGDYLFYLIFVIIIIPLFIWYVNRPGHHYTSAGTGKGIGLIAVVIAFIISFIIKLIVTRIAARRKASANYFYLPSEDKPIDKTQQKITKILAQGRKTIATIVSVEYIPVNPNYSEYELDTFQFATHDDPYILVKYKFNPPDDEREDDLVHIIKLREMPEAFLKKGDPLPILYRIYRDKLHQEHVDSMPFPIVLSDICYLSDLIGSNINRRDAYGNIILKEEKPSESKDFSLGW